MDWKWQLVISIGVPIFTSLLTYIASIKKSNREIEAVKINANTEIEKANKSIEAVRINADTEIKKIKEESDKEIKNIEIEYQKQIEKIKIETEEQIKLKIAENDINTKHSEDDIKNKHMDNFMGQFIENPQLAFQKLQNMQKVANKFPNNKKKK